jgi:isoprenylcysteine carboxyl methyltransferase (ICMT) family protein YpbQ
MITGTVKGVTYYKITTAGAEDWSVDVTDIKGNVVSEMVIEVDTTLGACNLLFPAISTLKNFWNTKVTVIALTGATNDVVITPFNSVVPPLVETNTIGSASTLSLTSDGMTVEVNVASSTVWYGVATA